MIFDRYDHVYVHMARIEQNQIPIQIPTRVRSITLNAEEFSHGNARSFSPE